MSECDIFRDCAVFIQMYPKLAEIHQKKQSDGESSFLGRKKFALIP
jgi:hypothetical protein